MVHVLHVESEVKLLSRVQLFATPWTVAHQPPPSMGFWSGLLEWVAISFARGSSQPRDRTWVSHIPGRRLNLWATREDLESTLCMALKTNKWFLLAILGFPVAQSASYSSDWLTVILQCQRRVTSSEGFSLATFSLRAPHVCLFTWLHRVLVAAHGIFSRSVHTLSCRIWDLVPGPPTLGVQSLSPWTTREVPTTLSSIASFPPFLILSCCLVFILLD